MNELYERFLEREAMPRQIVDCAMGRIKSPIAGLASASRSYGFPPALCPIWSDASLPLYIGYWRHWFSTRRGTFVAMYINSGHKVYEVARTPSQLYCHVIASAIVAADGITPEIKKFSADLEIENLE